MLLDTLRWVPRSTPGWQEELPRALDLLAEKRICLLTGAGFSTESGIPDYRGEETARRARNPIRFQQFVRDVSGRRRYWARAMVGWPRFRSAEPNRAHYAAAHLERRGNVLGVITQNVDRLHEKAGSRRVVELHGALAEVQCLGCGSLEHRDDLQARLADSNPDWLEQQFSLAPDGDADIGEDRLSHFNVPDCVVCRGPLKPRVVFFGEGVPRPVVEDAFALLDEAEALVVAGSSLAVFSGYRFVRRAKQTNKTLVIFNVGKTRGDSDAHAVINGNVGAVMERLAAELQRP